MSKNQHSVKKIIIEIKIFFQQKIRTQYIILSIIFCISNTCSPVSSTHSNPETPAMYPMQETVFMELAPTSHPDPIPITLPDSSSVLVFSNTHLTYKSRQGNDSVILDGEAFFKISKKTGRQSFTVIANDQCIHVIGTEFKVMVKPYTTTTLVIEGSVKVTVGGDEKKLRPGQQINSTVNRDIHISEFATEKDILQLQNNNYRFNNEKLSKVLPILEAWYRVKFICKGNVSDLPFTDNWSFREPLSSILTRMAQVNKLKYGPKKLSYQAGDTIKIYK